MPRPRRRQSLVFLFLLLLGTTHTIFPLNYYSTHPRQSAAEGQTSSILNFINRFRDVTAQSNRSTPKLRHAVSENLLTSSSCNEGRPSEFGDEYERYLNQTRPKKNGARAQVTKLSGGRGFGRNLDARVDISLGLHPDSENIGFSKSSKFPRSLSKLSMNSRISINEEPVFKQARIPADDALLNDTCRPFSMKSLRIDPARQGSHLVFPHHHPVAGLLTTSAAFESRMCKIKMSMRKDLAKNGFANRNPVDLLAAQAADITELKDQENSKIQSSSENVDALQISNAEATVTNITNRVIDVITDTNIPTDSPSADKTPTVTSDNGRTVGVQREDSLNLTAVAAADLVESVHALCTQGEVESALEVVRTDLRNISHPQCTAVLHEFAMAGRADCAQAALLHMQVVGVEVGVGLDSATYEELLLAYARDEATRSDEGLDQAFAVLDLMARGGVEPNLVSYNRLMEACSAAADCVDTWERGLRLLDTMREHGVKPSVDTYNTLLEAVGRRGWSRDNGGGLDRGAALLARMTEDNVSASTDTFNMLMYGCAWAAGAGDGWGGVERGLGFLEAMAEMSAMPDVITFNNLIAACAQVCVQFDAFAVCIPDS